jgi:hypothetical protein
MNNSAGQIAFFIVLLAFWFVLNRWILPMFGVKT